MRALLLAGAIILVGGALAQENLNVPALLRQAAELEAKSDGRGAVKVYVSAARGGSPIAARRLAEIYDKGLFGIERNYAESLKWYNYLRVIGGEKVQGGWDCPPRCGRAPANENR